MKTEKKIEETTGDVIRINITPPSDTFPWIRIFRHPEGIKRSAQDVGGIDAKRTKTREQIASEIGNEIIKNSKILSDWYK